MRARDANPGPEVTEVVGGSSAAHAGVKVADRIVALDQTATPDTATLVYELRRRQAGTRAQLTVQRGKHRITVTATLDDVAATTAPEAAGTSPVALVVRAPG